MRILLLAFPGWFRRRYGDELLELARAGGTPVRDGTNIVLAGLRMRLDELSGRLRGRGSAGHVLSLTLIAAAATGSFAFGGCLVLGSIAAAGSGALALHHLRPPFSLAG